MALAGWGSERFEGSTTLVGSAFALAPGAGRGGSGGYQQSGTAAHHTAVENHAVGGGVVVETWVQLPALGTHLGGAALAADTSGGGTGYVAFIDGRNSTGSASPFQLRVDPVNGVASAAATGITLVAGAWYRVRLSWTPGVVSGRLFDEAGTLLADLSFADSKYQTLYPGVHGYGSVRYDDVALQPADDGALWSDIDLDGAWGVLERAGSWDALPDRAVRPVGRRSHADRLADLSPVGLWRLDRNRLAVDAVAGVAGTWQGTLATAPAGNEWPLAGDVVSTRGEALTVVGTLPAAAGPFGEPGAALDFNGSSRATGSPAVPTSGSYSLDAWINPDVLGARGIIGWGTYGTANTVNALRLGSNGELHNYWWANDLTSPWSVIKTGVWQHVAAVYDHAAGTHVLYVNGAEVARRTGVTWSGAPVSNFAVGVTNGTNEHFDGRMAHVGVWSRALTADEVATRAATPGDSILEGRSLAAGSDGSLRLDGSTYLENAHRAAFNVGGALSIVAVVEFDQWSGTSYRAILSKQGGSGRDYNLYGYSSDGVNMTTLHFSSYVLGAHAVTLPTPVVPGQRAHVAFTVDATGGRYYLDGVQVGATQAAPTGVANQTAPVWIGRADNNWTGRIDDVALFNRALTSSEVADLAAAAHGEPLATAAAFPSVAVSTGARPTPVSHGTTSGFGYGSTVLGTDPLAYWRFSEADGATVIRDVTGHGHDGTVVGAVGFNAGAVTESRGGEFSGGYLTVEGAPNVTGNQTIAMWLRPDVLNDRRNPWNRAYGGEGTITQEPSGILNYYYGTNGGNGNPYQGFGSGTALVTGRWQHVALVRDLDAMQLRWYIDGVQTATVAASYAQAAATSGPVWIGDGYVQPYDGGIDEVGLWNRALSASEVAALAAGTGPAVSTSSAAKPETLGTRAVVQGRRRAVVIHDTNNYGTLAAELAAAGYDVTTNTAITSVDQLSGYDIVAADARVWAIPSNVGALLDAAYKSGLAVYSTGNDTSTGLPLITAAVGKSNADPWEVNPKGSGHWVESGWTAMSLDADTGVMPTGVRSDVTVIGTHEATVTGVTALVAETGAGRWVHVQPQIGNIGNAQYKALLRRAWAWLFREDADSSVAVSTGWTVEAATAATSIQINAPGTSSREFAPVHPTTTGFGAPSFRLGAGPTPATRTTTTGFGAPGLSTGWTVTPSAHSTGSGFGAPALAALENAPTHATTTGFGAPALASLENAPTHPTSSGFGTPAFSAVENAPTHPTTIGFGTPALASLENAPTHATSSGFGTPALTSAAGPAAHATSIGFGAPALASLENAPTHSTTTGFGAPALASLENAPTHPTAVAFGSPALASLENAPTHATSIEFGAPALAAVENAPTHATASGFGTPALSTGWTVTPSTHLLTGGVQPAPGINARHFAVSHDTSSTTAAPALSTGWTAAAATRGTTAGFPSITPNTDWRHTASSHSTAVAFGSPALAAVENAPTHATAVAFGAPALAALENAPTHPTTTGFGTPALAALENAPTHPTTTGFGTPALASLENAPTHATSIVFGAPALASLAGPTTRATTTSFPSITPNTDWTVSAATRTTSVGFSTPGQSQGATPTPAARATTTSFPSITPNTDWTVSAATRATAAGFPPAGIGVAPYAVTHTTSSTVGTPAISQADAPDTHATSSTVGTPGLSTGMTPLPAVHPTTATIEPFAVTFTARPLPATAATVAGFPTNPPSVGSRIYPDTVHSSAEFPVTSLSMVARPATIGTEVDVNAPRGTSEASPLPHETAAAFGTPALRTGWTAAPSTRATSAGFGAPALTSRENAPTHSTSTGFGTPALSTGWTLTPSTRATAAGFGAPALASRENAPTHPTSAAFGPPAITTTAVATPAGITTVAVVSVPIQSQTAVVPASAHATITTFGTLELLIYLPPTLDLEASYRPEVLAAASYAADLAVDAAYSTHIAAAAERSVDVVLEASTTDPLNLKARSTVPSAGAALL